tara:strand:- start:4147 stop:5481 length:1335 start_codon:yes stop_codon:yes gene_type:complete
MASTVTPSTFQVRIKEDHVINGIRTVNENLYRVPNVTNYDRRIVTVPANTNVDLINTNGLVPGPALFPSYSIAYGRITNMDDVNRLAVTFTSSNGESETGNVGSDLSGSYTSGGTGGTAAIYSNIPTTTNGSGSGMTLRVITDETINFSPSVTLTPAATTLAAIGTYNIGLEGGTGTGASGSIVVTAGAGNDASIPTYTSLTFTASGSGYSIADQLVIPVGALSNGNLVKGSTITNISIPSVSVNQVKTNVPITTSTGQGATATVTSAGNLITTVIINAVGLGYAVNQDIIIKESVLQSLGFGAVSENYIGNLSTANMASSIQNILPALQAANITVKPTNVTIQTGGNKYAVGDTLIVAKALIGTSTTDLLYTLNTNDFSRTGTKSYWTMECLPTSSIMFSSPNCSGSQFNGIFEQDIEFISVYALTGSIDVEYVLVNAPVATN